MEAEAQEQMEQPEVVESEQQEGGAAEQVAEQVSEQVEPSEQSEDSAFEAGFSEARGDEPSKPASDLAPAQEPQLIAGFTEEQIRDAIAKAAEIDKLREQLPRVFGTLGSMKQSLDQLRNQPRASAQVQISKDKFARLSKEFPEMAELIAQDLSEALGSVSGPSVDPQEIRSELEKVKTELKQESEAKLLTVMHKDWRDVVKSQDFAQWTQTLPEEDRNELGNSWDATFIGDKLTEFKAWKDKTVASQQVKQKRLEAAITPKGGAAMSSTQTEMDAFLSGFKAVRGIK